MKYYDVLRQYISIGSELPENQFEKIKGNKDFLGAYFRSRSRYIEDYSWHDLSSYELDFLQENPRYFYRMSKKALFNTLMTSLERHKGMLANVIIQLFGDKLDWVDIVKIIPYSNDSKFFAEVYEKHPEWFSTVYMKSRLLKMGVLDKSEVNTVFKMKIRDNDLHSYFNGGRQWIIADILHYKSSNFCEHGGLIAPSIMMKYSNQDNIAKALNIMGYGDNVGNFGIALNNMGDELKNIINKAFSDSVYDDCARVAYEGLKNALSHYGDVVELNKKGAVIMVDISKFDLTNAAQFCGDDDLECFFNVSFGRGTIEKPYMDIDVIDKDVFNKVLADKLAEL